MKFYFCHKKLNFSFNFYVVEFIKFFFCCFQILSPKLKASFTPVLYRNPLMFSSTSFMGSLKKSESPVHWILIQMYGVRYGSFYLFSKSLSSCLKITYLKVHRVPMIWDATFTIHQISICIWANFWTSYSASLLCLAIHAPNYTILIAGALWYVLISGRTHPHHTAFLLQFFCLFLFHINFSINSRKNKKPNPSSVFSGRSC